MFTDLNPKYFFMDMDDRLRRSLQPTRAELDQPGFDSIQEFFDDNNEWSIETFGAQSVAAPLLHLKNEVDEVIEALECLRRNHEDIHEEIAVHENIQTEFADCLILLMQSASNYGITFQQLFLSAKDKMTVNKSRTWQKPDEQGRCFHVKTPSQDLKDAIDSTIIT